MSRQALQDRDNWQNQSGPKAEKAENRFYNAFQKIFEKQDKFVIIDHPKTLDSIYMNVKLDNMLASRIYNPPIMYKKHGINPDYAIYNKQSNKTLFIEVKRQDGWVEGKKPSAGRGNAHERGCKYFTPGIMKLLRYKSHIHINILPFWLVFQGDIARDPKRVREITFWFDKYNKNYTFWSNQDSDDFITNFFYNNLARYLE